MDAAPACLRDLYGELHEALTAWGEVEVAPLLHYIAYRRMAAHRHLSHRQEGVTRPTF